MCRPSGKPIDAVFADQKGILDALVDLPAGGKGVSVAQERSILLEAAIDVRCLYDKYLCRNCIHRELGRVGNRQRGGCVRNRQRGWTGPLEGLNVFVNLREFEGVRHPPLTTK